MVVWKQIKVMFFLGVMGIMMLHNALPHVHHAHESHGEVTTKAKNYGHAHGHAHHHGHQHINHHTGVLTDYHLSAQANQQVYQPSDAQVDHDHSRNAGHQPDAPDKHYSDQLANRHSDEQDNEDDPRGFLFSLLLDNHSHSFHTHEIIQLAKPGNHYILDKHVHDRVVFDFHRSFLEFENQYLHRFSLFKQAYYDNPLSLDSPLRGPPSIG